jgi:serine/threonine protein kinase
MAPLLLGKYKINGQLGHGAMGVVFDGFDPVIGRRVAIKAVHRPNAADWEQVAEFERFHREAVAAGRLNHPNVVSVIDYGETDELGYIVMEFVDGPTLKSLLDKDERLALHDICRIMADLLEGLQYSHDRKVVHRDIKPSNLILTSDGRTKISDFGVAQMEGSTLTQTGTVLGTPAYMSPEQLKGDPVDWRTDIYSSAVVLYQLLTGELPFAGKNFLAILHGACYTEPVVPSQLSVIASPALDAVVLRAMAKGPGYATAKAFAAALDSALVPVDATPIQGRSHDVAPQPSMVAARQSNNKNWWRRCEIGPGGILVV